ncbi:MAG TPA: alpha/beta hydrolase [Candidatus Angelobacter sp.]|jgi:proline iminopeptidase
MKSVLVFAILFACASASSNKPRETHVPVAGGAQLYVREIGQGPAIVVLHGGPDFDQSYLLPEMDRLSDKFRLIYYDQRGRGRSAENVRPEDVSIESEMEDLDAVRRHFQLNTVVLLGHSWGTVLALEYATRHPERVSRLILMNPAPASAADLQQFVKERQEKWPEQMEKRKAIAATAAYKEADPEAVTAYYRPHFKPALARSEDYDKLITRMHAAFIRQGSAGILKARAVETRLVNDTWAKPGYDLLPKLNSLKIPTLVIYSDHDFIPTATAEHIAQAIPGARMVTLKDCGHFPYMECPDAARRQIDAFFNGSK